MTNQVICITKPHPHSPLEHITHIGGRNPGGEYFYITREVAIAGIESGQWSFHVKVGRYDVPVVVAPRYPAWVKTDRRYQRSAPALSACA